MKRLLAVLAFLFISAVALADNYSGGGGGGGPSSVTLNTTCPTSTQTGSTLTLNGAPIVNAKTGSYGPFTTDCGQAFVFTLSAVATYSLPAPASGFYIPAVTNVPSSTAALTISPASGQICAATCAATYTLGAGAITISLISDGTNYYVQQSPAATNITGPGYVINNWYVPDNFVNIVASTLVPSTTTTYCYPMWFNNILPGGGGTGTIGNVAVNVTTLGGNLQIAIYNNVASTNTPGTLVAATASIVVSTTGIKTGAITAAGIAQGLYWICSQTDNTALRASTLNTGIIMSHKAGSSTAAGLFTNVNVGLSTPGTFGTWPNLTSSTWTMVSGIEPLVEVSFTSIP